MEYEKLIDTIMTTEQAAQQIAQDAKMEGASLDTVLASECEKIQEFHMQQAREKAQKLEEETAGRTQQSLSALDQKLADGLDNAAHLWQEHFNDWSDALFHMIIADKAVSKAGDQT